MSDIRIGDSLSLLDGEWVVEGMQGGCLRLWNVHSQQVQVLHVTALARLLAIPPRISPDVAGPRSFDTITDDEATEVAERARHVEEVIYGKPRGVESGRPEYDPETTGLRSAERRAGKDAAAASTQSACRGQQE